MTHSREEVEAARERLRKFFKPWFMNPFRDDLNIIVAHIEELEAALREAKTAMQKARGSTMAHHSGGDPAMIFDHDDALIEHQRRGYYTIDDHAFDLWPSVIERIDAALIPEARDE